MSKLKDQIFALKEEGKSYNQIAKLLNCSKGTISYYCGVGVKEKTVARNRDRRKNTIKLIQKYKQEQGCVDCKENYPYWMLDLDHCRGIKVSNVSTMVSTHPVEQVWEEVQKCDVVCSNCHRVRTWSRLVKSGGDTKQIENYYL